MKIIRAGINDADVFNKSFLDFGACCFYTEDKAFKYFFEIKGREATLCANTGQYIRQAIEEFLFYSSFITSIKDKDGNILTTRTPSQPCLHEISKIQPSQFYINEKKLEACKRWIKRPEDIIIPIVAREDKIISLDGHTRLRAALDFGYASVYIYPDEYDASIFRFVDEAIKRKIYGVSDMELVSDEEYAKKWDKFCDDLFERLSGIMGTNS